MEPETVAKEPIAIIGTGCVLPDAPDVEAFWNNLLAGKNSIREVPADRWDPELYWDADKDAADKTYAKIGGFVLDDAFNGIEYRMPPKVVEHVDASQRWALSAARQAMAGAGYKTGIRGDDGKDFDRDRCAVIIGNAMGGETNKTLAKRLFWPEARRAIEQDPAFQELPATARQEILARAEKRYKAGVPEVSEDSMPGHLSNVIAGRIANAFDLGGKNFTTDAACASSLAALDAAVDTLRDGDADLVLWGGSDRSMDITGYVEFSKIGALSPDGSRPFDKDANGFVMGEGCAMFLLKRLSDAERDGDQIHAVVRGIGSSSDGKGKGITAPNPAGQVKAVRRAYKDAGVNPATIGYLEAHGTSTPVGDPVELTSVHEAFSEWSTDMPPGSIAVGSVKSNIGHLKAAAGAAGMLKAVLALKQGTLPPSINVRELNPRIDWAASPFRVQTEAAAWPRPPTHPRRAAVSSFGFGGTNFHVVVDEYIPGHLMTQAPAAEASPQTVALDPALEPEPVVFDAATLSTDANLADGRLRDVLHPITARGLVANQRMGTSLADPAELPKKIELAKKAATNPAAARLAFNQGVFINQGAPEGKVAFLFPGQGTQYVNMLREVAQKYQVVRSTFHEADEVLFDDLGGIKLTDILWPTPDTPETRKAAEEKLKLTEFTQPAVLAADVALLRLLEQWGIKPDVVAGHSLGEYGALVAAGVLSFADALHAVAARGREMANVEVPDLGKMAAVPADWETVGKAIANVDGYVIPANKNCPSQTVLAGSSDGVDQAVAALQAQGLQAQYLPVSAAFHSEIVAPASKPLRNVLGRLNVQSPKVRILSNVGAKPYPDDPDAIRDNLAVQVASPVEWIGIMERMHDEGVRTFIEVGPKRALTGFALDILKGKDAVAICSNHPKKGGIAHVNELFAFLGAWGFQPTLPALDDALYTPEFRMAGKALAQATAATTAATPAATHAAAASPASERAATTTPAGQADPRLDVITEGLRGILAQLDGAAKTGEPATPGQTVAHADTQPTSDAMASKLAAFGVSLDDIGISGISVGLPGKSKQLFDDNDWDRILAGENLIDSLGDNQRGKLAEKNIVRLVKGKGGEASFQVIDDVAQVIHLAGQRGGFDISEWGVDGDFASVLDRTFQYAIAAGLEALKDAGIPLQRTYFRTSTGSLLPKEWKLPEPLRDETGIIFASAFPGYDNLIRDISQFLADKYAGRSLDELQRLYDDLIGTIQDPELRTRVQGMFDDEFERLQSALPDRGAARYEFNRKFLFSVLSMGHAQLAQFIGARGPNTQLNAACASTTQAIAMAEDWIRTGRARRVLVVGADDVTSDAMFEWVGSGFLASGAATTKANVKDAALPFDKRRHGMIVGMGAVGLVVEAAPETEARGMRPIAKLLATEVANSAFHGSRLDVDHIAACMTRLAGKAQQRYGVVPEEIAAKTVFMSHETYTPARGGSASAEIHALRATFGDQANKVVIANTKGFTGHPQGAGVEDAIALKCLQRGAVPPIANFRDPDPELGDLNLSKGGPADVHYALRLAAGFGSQVAMTLTQLVAREDERIISQATYDGWLAQITGIAGARTEIGNRTLRIVDDGRDAAEARTKKQTPAALTAPVAPAAPAATTQATPDEVLAKLTDLVAEKTGYPTDMLDPDMDMEADLGIDTVKQAELFGLLREAYNVPLEDGLQIKDYPTLRKVAGYMAEKAGMPATPATAQASKTPTPAAEVVVSQPSAAQVASPDEVLAKLTDLVAEKTGYPTDMLDPDMDMEADLGIDTVKQAELFGLLREAYNVPLEEGLQIKDYPTLRKVAGYMAEKAGSPASAAPTPAIEAVPKNTKQATLHAVPSEETQQAANPDDVLAKLTDLVAEKTGYPTDMLEPDLDMEADLGIDTVKQAELFGLLREAYNVPLEEGLQIKDYPTLRAVAGYMAEKAGASSGTADRAPAEEAHVSPAVATPAEVVETPETARSAAEGADQVLAIVTGIVAEQTGYPEEMLEPELDMEADLGIDTVKQAEMVGKVRERFGIPAVEGLQLKDIPTLQAVAQFVLDNQPSTTADAAGMPAEATVGTPAEPALETPGETTAAEPAGVEEAEEGTTDGAIVRREPVCRPAPLPEETNAITRGPVLVVGDADEAVMRAFTNAGFQPSFQADKPVGLLIIATRANQDLARLGHAFEAAKAHPMGSGQFVCVVTSQDGTHGLREVHDASMAAIAGLGKALRKEFPDAVTKVIDMDDVRGEWVVDEVTRGTRTEVCYRNGMRQVIDVAPVPLAESTPDVAGKNLIVSGGAQGITVEMLAALAPQGPRLLLLGRTHVPSEAAAWAALDEAGWGAKRDEVMAAMRASGDKVTPVSVQKAMAPMEKAAEVHQTISRLESLGAEVSYEAVDVTDQDAVAEVVGRFRERHGPIHGIIHAAGVEISKDIHSKDRAQFDLVTGVKMAGLEALLESTRGDPLAWLGGFGSVAGRFGNIGQVDYSAANEYLAKAIKAAAAERGIPTAFTIAWGPWGEVGMATRGSILQIMEASGVTPIPTAEGVRHFLNEMGTLGIRECVVAGTLGAIDVDKQVVATSWNPLLDALNERIGGPGFRLLHKITKATEEGLVAEVVVDRTAAPYLDDHSIDGVPTFPGVFGIEAFAQAASLLDDGTFLGAEHVSFASPLKQLKGPVTASLEVIRISAEEETQQRYACTLTTQFVAPDGKVYGEPRLHFSATVCFGDAPEGMKTEAIPETNGERTTATIYPPFFHGPSFQVLAQAGPFGDESVGTYLEPAAQFDGATTYLSHPMVNEALFQLCGLRTMVAEGAMSLPFAIERLDILDDAEGDLVLWCERAGDAEGHRRFHAAATKPDGTIVIRMQGYAMIETGPVQLDVPDAPANGAEAPATEAEPTEAADTTKAPDAPAMAEPSEADVALPELDGVAFAAVAVEEAPLNDWFTQAELDEHAAFKVPKRANEWRAGRLAAKMAVRKASPTLAPTDIEVRHDADAGFPVLHVHGKPIDVPLSITHRDGTAIAAVSDQDIGIDLETVEARESSFVEQACSPEERDVLATSSHRDLELTCIWSAKEAALKRLRTGLRADLTAIHVRADGEGGALVHAPDGTFGVRFFDVQGRVLAVSHPAYDARTEVANA